MTDPNTPEPNNPEEAALADEWASALSDQADDGALEDDPWASALAEQEAAVEEQLQETPQRPAPKVFKPLTGQPGGGTLRDLDMIMDIPVKMSVELGRTRITIKQLLELAQGSVVGLDGLAGEPMDILINGYLIAQGEVVVVDEKYGIRITEIITPSERVQKLNR
ncbi:MAG: flagellar motor switch protein FliN [Pseudomonas sp.]|uniref:flagellar motor switch protein FliN n=1 Tax=Pseudomonas abieticivorans TaxID=2931382 RepID=UPI0020C152FB|nr:flagellar motor switch protein FliN [Pseudomonas sp. PIA16]MDE1168401.1 flagellar motor switch protein FliN [Pseudomonas sp.]